MRLFSAAISRLSASRWYLPSSLSLEWLAYNRVRNGFQGLVHLLWADRDWGFLDQVVNHTHVGIVGTFHACPDDFASVIASPQRLSQMKAVILMSKTQRPNFLNSGMPSSRIHVIPHGIDIEHFRPAVSRENRSGQLRVIHVGNYRRNFAVLREICCRTSNDPRFEMTIVGNEAERNRFSALNRVKFVSGLSNGELLELYQASDCMLMTATGATANNALLEGMACGLPIVAEAIGAIPEYVDSGCAFLVAPENADDAVHKLSLLADSPQLLGKMRQAARARAVEFDWRLIANRTQKVYDNAMSLRN